MDAEMTNRRRFLKGVSAGIAGLFVASAASAANEKRGLEVQDSLSGNFPKRFDRESLVGQSQIPEAMVETHTGQVVRLYDDLIKDKVVMINFMSIEHEAVFPISSKLTHVARLLGTRLGRDVHMISITHDPIADTSDRLRKFATAMGAPLGWHFVRATGEGNAMLLARLYHHGRRKNVNIQIDMVHYGNAAVGLWAAFPSDIQADDAIMRIASVMNGSTVRGPLTQGGPRRLGDPGPSFTNRVA